MDKSFFDFKKHLRFSIYNSNKFFFDNNRFLLFFSKDVLSCNYTVKFFFFRNFVSNVYSCDRFFLNFCCYIKKFFYMFFFFSFNDLKSFIVYNKLNYFYVLDKHLNCLYNSNFFFKLVLIYKRLNIKSFIKSFNFFSFLSFFNNLFFFFFKR